MRRIVPSHQDGVGTTGPGLQQLDGLVKAFGLGAPSGAVRRRTAEGHWWFLDFDASLSSCTS